MKPSRPSELEPVKFNYKGKKDKEASWLYAEDVPELVAAQDRNGLNSMDIVAVLTKVVQKQQAEIETLKQQMVVLAKDKKYLKIGNCEHPARGTENIRDRNGRQWR